MIALGIIARLIRNGDGLCNLWVHVVAIAAFGAALDRRFSHVGSLAEHGLSAIEQLLAIVMRADPEPGDRTAFEQAKGAVMDPMRTEYKGSAWLTRLKWSPG